MPEERGAAGPGGRWIFGAVVFLASFLLLICEPMVAKQMLPGMGGSSAVWITCLVFFQAALLAGYAYAHWLGERAGRLALIAHLALLAGAVTFALAWARGGWGGWSVWSVWSVPGSANPVERIFVALGLSVGVPFVVMASTSPLLQVWFARVKGTGVPYGLFGVSNLASLLALLLYPTVVEPWLTLQTQRAAWAAGVCGFALLSLAIMAQVLRAGRRMDPELSLQSEPPTPGRVKAMWFLLPLGASVQLSAVTGHLTTNIAAIPLLWVLPLAVYLLTFVLAFEAPRLYKRALVLRLLAVMLASLGYMLSKTDVSLPISVAILFFLLELFTACLLLHGETYRLRPERKDETTIFYLMIAAGGAAGSFLVGIVAPLVFRANYDLALSFLATAALSLLVTWRDGRTQRLLWATAVALMLLLTLGLRRAYWGNGTIMAERNFYGSLRVRDTVTSDGWPERMLMNGTIEHGTQLELPELRRTPTTYYAEDSGVGLALKACADRPRRIGVIGLGAGTIAAYGRAGDTLRFYELNPAVEPVARNLFTYIREAQGAGAAVTIVTGDARTTLTQEPPRQLDVLVVDAFTGDAIPLHLLTMEALAVYRRHLAPGGVLAFHVSNQYVDLQPEIARVAHAAGMDARAVESYSIEVRGEFRASWVLVAADPAYFQQPALRDHVAPIDLPRGGRPWTDDYSSLARAIRW